jgi:hypothetical protein
MCSDSDLMFLATIASIMISLFGKVLLQLVPNMNFMSSCLSLEDSDAVFLSAYSFRSL